MNDLLFYRKTWLDADRTGRSISRHEIQAERSKSMCDEPNWGWQTNCQKQN